MSKLYDIEEPPEGMFPLSFNLIELYLRENPILTESLNAHIVQRGIFAEAGVL